MDYVISDKGQCHGTNVFRFGNQANGGTRN